MATVSKYCAVINTASHVILTAVEPDKYYHTVFVKRKWK